MMKELDFLEISFSRIIPEPELLAEISRLLKLDQADMWNWDWPGEAPDLVYTPFSYIVGENLSTRCFYPLFFNKPPQVPVGIEVEIGYALAHHFDCLALINDFSDSADGL
jgi:hypothetical protein